MNVSLTADRLRDYWDRGRNDPDFYEFLQLLAPDVLKDVCDRLLAAFEPLLTDELTDPLARKLRAATDDPVELEHFRRAAFEPTENPQSILDKTDYQPQAKPRVLLWCHARAYYNLHFYPGTLVELEHLHRADALGPERDTLGDALRALADNNPATARIARENFSVDDAYHNLTFQYLLEALNAHREGFTPLV